MGGLATRLWAMELQKSSSLQASGAHPRLVVLTALDIAQASQLLGTCGAAPWIVTARPEYQIYRSTYPGFAASSAGTGIPHWALSKPPPKQGLQPSPLASLSTCQPLRYAHEPAADRCLNPLREKHPLNLAGQGPAHHRRPCRRWMETEAPSPGKEGGDTAW